jgi:SecD/SecF fusion protein
VRIEAVQDIEETDLLEKFQGGVMFVVGQVTPAVDEREVLQRIRILRQQTIGDKDLRGLAHNETEARLLGMDAQGRPEFAVVVRPSETPANWDEFARKEEQLLTEALHREEALIVSNFDAQIAGETRGLAIVAIVLSWGAIVLYVWLRFGSIQWGLAAVICLIHDVIIVVGLVAVSGWLHDTFLGRAMGISSFKIDLAMIAAVLTVIGYSVNDTIVVFDRIRENRGKLKTISASTINLSINQTLARTLLTSSTTFIVVFVMYAWGGTGIRHFNFALLAGILFGTYSSVAVASPLLMGFRKALIARAAKDEQATE